MKTRATAYPIWNRFQRSPDAPLSLREQLVRFFRKGVADGTLQSGIRLPASRVLAQELEGGSDQGVGGGVFHKL